MGPEGLSVSPALFFCFFYIQCILHTKFTNLRLQMTFLCSRSTQINVYFTWESRKLGGLDGNIFLTGVTVMSFYSRVANV